MQMREVRFVKVDLRTMVLKRCRAVEEGECEVGTVARWKVVEDGRDVR